jgi:hypothetical protein
MKKRYITPEMETVMTVSPVLLTGSGVDSELGIDYGGVDGTGGLEPSARGFDDFE